MQLDREARSGFTDRTRGPCVPARSFAAGTLARSCGVGTRIVTPPGPRQRPVDAAHGANRPDTEPESVVICRDPPSSQLHQSLRSNRWQCPRASRDGKIMGGIPCSPEIYAEGVSLPSPGLSALGGLPWVRRNGKSPTLKGLHLSAHASKPREWNPFRVLSDCGPPTQGSPTEVGQPWAEV